MKKWTKEETDFLIENYSDKGSNYCAKCLDRTARAIGIKASRLNLKFGWSDQEIEFLTLNYPDNGPTYCAEKLNKTVAAVGQKAYRLNLTRSKASWSEQEVQFLIDNYANNGPSYCVKHLNRTYYSVQMKAGSLNLQANTTYDSNIVYVLYFPDLFLYKVGITSSVDRRIKEFGHPCVVLKTQEYEPIEAAQLERNLLKSVTLINTGALNSGNTETFMQPSREIEEFLSKQFA